MNLSLEAKAPLDMLKSHRRAEELAHRHTRHRAIAEPRVGPRHPKTPGLQSGSQTESRGQVEASALRLG